ncbi:hypothetical protein BKA62DRAFT_721004 [Auriculariales sp. MPI-PUGE-AT-0066]|nr:hypothetical protein BKA62DRAFT_721004 [Auriculariales sp. MPI-PUGE-AT-0066]
MLFQLALVLTAIVSTVSASALPDPPPEVGALTASPTVIIDPTSTPPNTSNSTDSTTAGPGASPTPPPCAVLGPEWGGCFWVIYDNKCLLACT